MVVRKRCLAWDWTNTRDCPDHIKHVDFNGPMHTISNWNVWKPPELKDQADFRPMIRLKEQLEGEEWQTILRSEAEIVHYFNEPERAGISSEFAAQKWLEQVVPTLREEHQKKLVSPSCASDPAGQTWFKDFMGKVKDHPPDYIGVHWYGTSSAECRKFLSQIHEAYPEQKIIVSEIASISRNKKNVFAFTRNMANWMDQTEWIFEYTFFGCMRDMPDEFVSPAARLMTPDGQFTELMMLLMQHQPIKKEDSHKAQAAEIEDECAGTATNDKPFNQAESTEDEEPDDEDIPDPKPYDKPKSSQGIMKGD